MARSFGWLWVKPLAGLVGATVIVDCYGEKLKGLDARSPTTVEVARAA